MRHFSLFSQQHKEKEIKSLLDFERRKGIVDQAVSRLNSWRIWEMIVQEYS